MKLTPELKEIAQRVINSMYHDGKTVGNAFDFLEGFLAALPNSEPVAQVKVSASAGNAGITWIATAVNDFDSLPILKDGTKLYAAPPIPQDYKAQLAESQAREAKLRSAFHANMIRAFHSMSHAEVSDEIDKAVGLTSSSALNELIAKAGEVMRERCSTRCGGGHNKLSGRLYAESIRALPGVTLEDLKS